MVPLPDPKHAVWVGFRAVRVRDTPSGYSRPAGGFLCPAVTWSSGLKNPAALLSPGPLVGGISLAFVLHMPLNHNTAILPLYPPHSQAYRLITLPSVSDARFLAVVGVGDGLA
jgi:hypothetical protein